MHTTSKRMYCTEFLYISSLKGPISSSVNRREEKYTYEKHCTHQYKIMNKQYKIIYFNIYLCVDML